MVVPSVVGPAAALPADRPAAALDADVVGRATRHQDSIGSVFDRQGAVVLQQHGRGGDGAPRELAVVGGADLRQQAALGERMLEQAELELDAKDSPDRVVDPVRAHVAGLHRRQQIGDECLVVVGHHDHVDPGIHRR